MEGERNRRLVIPYTFDLTTHGGVGRTALLEGGSVDGHDDVATGYLQQTNETLQTVADEVASQFIDLFTTCHTLGRGHTAQVTTVGADHDGKLTQATLGRNNFTIIHLVTEGNAQRSCIGDATLTAFVRKKTGVNRVILLNGITNIYILNPVAKSCSILAI